LFDLGSRRRATVLTVVASGSAFGGFTGALPVPARQALLAAGRQRRYRRDTRVFCEGDRSDSVIVIVEGRVKVTVTGADGAESVLGVRGPGAMVGELGAFDGSPRAASVVALEPLTVRILSTAEFRTFLAQQPGAALELVRMLVGRLREADRRRAEFGSYHTLARVAHLLADLIATPEPPATGAVAVRLSQQEIAGLVGASRESVARALATLRTRGLLATGRRTITVLDPGALGDFD
jgi:CRP/FNR family cyclic AMP-dependent transcriptional regulator